MHHTVPFGRWRPHAKCEAKAAGVRIDQRSVHPPASMSNTPGERRPHSDAPRGRHLQTRSHIDRMNPVVATGSPPSIARSSNRHFYTVTGTSRGQSTGLPGATTGSATAGRRASGRGSARPRRHRARTPPRGSRARAACRSAGPATRNPGAPKLLVPTCTQIFSPCANQPSVSGGGREERRRAASSRLRSCSRSAS